MSMKFTLIGFIVLLLSIPGCKTRDLRGAYESSPDGKTYLVIDDDVNGGECSPILVDGRPWRLPKHAAGAIAPGRHVIECGGKIGFQIKPGTTFHFDYWGP
jgi:hypothetical protein